MTISHVLVHQRPQPAPTTGPSVSIVVANRDGAAHLRRLVDGLTRRTHYRPIELVLVDNGSSDDSLRVLDEWSGACEVVTNADNASFSAANNQGVRAATGDLVLLANNDVDPVHPDWLGYMVESLADGVAAVGALLVYPLRDLDGREPAHPDLTVQHRGVVFDASRWGVRAVNAGAGGDPLALDPPRRRDVPAVTAACLLARRSDLEQTPFDESYWYGSEDWDLCLRLGNRGRVVVDERAVLFHHEYGTQDKYLDEAWLRRRTANHRRFNDLWGPALARRRREEVTGPPSGWFYRGHDAPRVHLVARKGRARLVARLRTEAERDGWEVGTGPAGPSDLVIALDPPNRVQWFLGRNPAVALVTDRERSWVDDGALDAADRVFALDRSVADRLAAIWGAGLTEVLPDDGQSLFRAMVEGSRPGAQSLRIGIATCAPDWDRARAWGDTHLARAFGRALRRLGHEATELIQEDWNGSAAAGCDVVVHLRGLRRRPVARGQWNLLWIISHPDRVEDDEYDDYDLVASASRAHAERLSRQLGRDVHFIPQATDADTFATARWTPAYDGAVLAVANGRRQRRGPRWLMRSGRPFQLYGRNWGDHPEDPYAYGDYVPNRELADAYRSAAVVVADHHGTMRTDGFLANRLFDVLAAGGVVLSDDVRGVEDLFGDLVPTYASSVDLDTRLGALLDDDAERRRLAREGRELVLGAHTLDHRARQWLRLLDGLSGPVTG